MALLADGSRICDAARVALAAINTNFTLTGNDQPIIFAGGIDLAAADRLRITGTITWFWRRVAGTFAQVAATGEIKFGANTVLVNGASQTNANKRTTQTVTSVDGALREFEGSSTGAPLVEVRDEQSGESQIALSVFDAALSQQYEMMLRCVHDAGTTDITFAALFTTAATRPASANDFTTHQKHKLRLRALGLI